MNYVRKTIKKSLFEKLSLQLHARGARSTLYTKPNYIGAYPALNVLK